MRVEIRNLLLVFSIVVFVLATINILHQDEKPNLSLEKLKIKYSEIKSPSVDHSKFPALQREFNSPQEVTETCNSCHTERHKEVMASSHWNWERVSYIEGKGVHAIGKKNVINNYCISAGSNEQACAKCHIGYGMTDNLFDFENAKNVDCMVCHDNSEEYVKGSSLAGYPDRSVNLTKVAQNVGSPTNMNCGSCHFYSGGGNNVKHGDLEEALLTAGRDIDVHMATDGLNMTCVDCHEGKNHQILGKLYSVSSDNTNRATCEQCHTNTPHFDQLLNTHNGKIACQTCHIPEYAKANATKMEWKWSEAGKLKDGEPYEIKDSLGNDTYMSIKGHFKWATNVVPDYVWFNGTADHYLLGEKIEDTSMILQINKLLGAHDDRDSKIVPVKIHRGDQIYDLVHKTLIEPKLYSATKGDSAYWKDFNWNESAAAGMKRAGLPYSGQYGFVKTEMYWPINHMVAPKEQALSCAQCHTRTNSRLAGLTDFYMPGRDNNPKLDNAGKWLIMISLLSVFAHAMARIISNYRKKALKS